MNTYQVTTLDGQHVAMVSARDERAAALSVSVDIVSFDQPHGRRNIGPNVDMDYGHHYVDMIGNRELVVTDAEMATDTRPEEFTVTRNGHTVTFALVKGVLTQTTPYPSKAGDTDRAYTGYDVQGRLVVAQDPNLAIQADREWFQRGPVVAGRILPDVVAELAATQEAALVEGSEDEAFDLHTAIHEHGDPLAASISDRTLEKILSRPAHVPSIVMLDRDAAAQHLADEVAQLLTRFSASLDLFKPVRSALADYRETTR